MKVKINHNARQEADRIIRYADVFEREHMETAGETLELARLRMVDQIIPGGAWKRKGTGVYGAPVWQFVPVSGATIQRRNRRTHRLYGPRIFHKSRVVSRTGKYLRVFKDKTPDLIMRTRRQGRMIVAEFGVQGSIEKQAAGLEFGTRGTRGRKPIRKALAWAAKRFLTLLARKAPALERRFER